MNIRLRGLSLSFIGGALFGLIAYWISHPLSFPFSSHPTGTGAVMFIGATGAAAFIGLVECATGRSFRDVKASWAALSRQQRFLWVS